MQSHDVERRPEPMVQGNSMIRFGWIIRLIGILVFGTRFFEVMSVGDPVADKTMLGSREDQFGRLLSNDNLRLDLYKFHQDRVEKIRSRLWTTLAWMAALQGALLSFMFEKLNLRLDQWLVPSIEQPKMALVLSIFGALFASYTLKIIDNGTTHIESNWRLSDIAIKKSPPHEKRRFRQRIRDSSFTELQIMGRLFVVVVVVQVVLVAVSAWSLVRLSGIAERIH